MLNVRILQSLTMIENFWMIVAYFLNEAVIACLMTVRNLLRCRCYCC